MFFWMKKALNIVLNIEYLDINFAHFFNIESQTIFYKLGQEYRNKTSTWLKSVAKKVKEERFNTATGIHKICFFTK